MRLVAVLLGTLLLGGVARAQQPALDDSAQARRLFDQGMAHFQLEEWDPAIEKWEAGFRLKPVPEFLYNIAQAYRLSKRPDKAVSFYQKYLRMAPKTPNRAEVERHIAALKAVIESQQSAATQPPTDTLPNPHAETKPVTPEPQKPANENANPNPNPNANANANAIVAAPEKKPITKKPWFWAVIGAGAALVVGGVVVGVVLGTSSSSNPNSLPDVHF